MFYWRRTSHCLQTGLSFLQSCWQLCILILFICAWIVPLAPGLTQRCSVSSRKTLGRMTSWWHRFLRCLSTVLVEEMALQKVMCSPIIPCLASPARYPSQPSLVPWIQDSLYSLTVGALGTWQPLWPYPWSRQGSQCQFWLSRGEYN